MRKKDTRGFTLLELLVSISIVGLILLGFFRVINSTIKINEKNDRDIKGINLAQSEIENLRSQIKSKGNEGYLEIKDIINPSIENPNSSYVNKDSINIPIKISSEGNIKWVEDNGNFILNIDDLNYTNKEDIKIKDKNGKIKIIKSHSQLIYKKEYIGNKYYTVGVVIKRKNIRNNAELYMYDISVQVKSDDLYFSEKETDISEVMILSNKLDHKDEDDNNKPNPIPPPVIIDEENYLTYCMKKASEAIYKAAIQNGEQSLQIYDNIYKLITINTIVGEKTLIDICKEEPINIVVVNKEIKKILVNIKQIREKEINNQVIDLLNEAEYYSIVGEYILKDLNVSVESSLDDAKNRMNGNIKDGYIQKYNIIGLNLTDEISKHADGLEGTLVELAKQKGEKLKGLIDKNRGEFSNIASNLYQQMHTMWSNPTNINERKAIETQINNFIDLIIKHQVYDIKKIVREEIPVDSRVEQHRVDSIIKLSENALEELDKVKKELVYIKALLDSSNYYNKN